MFCAVELQNVVVQKLKVAPGAFKRQALPQCQS